MGAAFVRLCFLDSGGLLLVLLRLYFLGSAGSICSSLLLVSGGSRLGQQRFETCVCSQGSGGL